MGCHEGIDNAEIKVFRHCAIADDNYETEPSTDLLLYNMSIEKDIKVQFVERVLKEVALDCELTKFRNIRPTDMDGTRDCNYSDCNYTCYSDISPAPRQMDDSTSNNIYYYDIKTIIRKQIIPLLIKGKGSFFIRKHDPLLKALNIVVDNLMII